MLSLFAERRLRAGQRASLEDLVGDLQRPPLARVGALSVDEFLPEDKRARLAFGVFHYDVKNLQLTAVGGATAG